MYRFAREVFEKKTALNVLVITNLKNTIEDTRFGVLWWILNPLILMGIYYFFIQIVLRQGGDNYHIFALCGIVCYQFFSDSLQGCTTALGTNTSLIKQTDLPLIIYMLINPIVQAIHCLFSVLVIIAFIPHQIGLHTFAIIPLIIVTAIYAMAFGIILSVLNVYVRDTINLVRYLLRLFFFLSPVLYTTERVLGNPHMPDIIKSMYRMNPLASLIPFFREVLMDGKFYNIQTFLILTIISLIIFEVSLLFFRKTANGTIKLL